MHPLPVLSNQQLISRFTFKPVEAEVDPVQGQVIDEGHRTDMSDLRSVDLVDITDDNVVIPTGLHQRQQQQRIQDEEREL